MGVLVQYQEVYFFVEFGSMIPEMLTKISCIDSKIRTVTVLKS